MNGVVQRRDVHGATDPDVIGARSGVRHRLGRRELGEPPEDLLLGPDARKAERLHPREERANGARVELAVAEPLWHGDGEPHTPTLTPRPVSRPWVLGLIDNPWKRKPRASHSTRARGSDARRLDVDALLRTERIVLDRETSVTS
jgi:hypothetical protein